MSDERPIVEEVVRFEELPSGALASRRAIVRWNDGTEGECARWYHDEVLSLVDHVRAAVRGVEGGEFRVMSMFMTSNHRRARCPASP
jgi:hypothetical protein